MFNKANIVIEILLPALVMILGTSIISIDFFFRSDSRVISPSRISTLPNAQKIVMKDNIYLDNIDSFGAIVNNTLTARDFGENLTGKAEYLDVHYKNKNDFDDKESFSTFEDYVFWYG